ncbi:MAG: hypothetical protein LC754_18205 [Acidobacteria bacterium]|nr:hypothetical protein [Acidobacteriota bacterium]
MRVTVSSMTVVAPTQGNITESSATVSSTGVFYGVVTGVARPFREPGVNISDTLPAGAPCCVPRFDENPEKIRVDSDGQPGTTALNLPAGTVLSNVTGPLDYSFRTYTILPDAATPPTAGALPVAQPVPARTASEVTVASFNMERFFDTVNDPSTSDPVLTATAFNNRLAKASLIIRTIQLSPDVIGVEEMENLTTLQAVADKINADAGTPNDYVPYLVEGNDVGGIDNGFLVRSSRINVVDVTQVGKTDTFTNPDNSTSTLNDRPPLVLRATAPRPAGGTFAFTVIVNHLRSLSGINDPAAGSNGFATEGDRIRFKRNKQAEFLANYIQGRQTNDPTEKILSVGDYNAFQFNDGYVDVIGTIKGTPSPDNTTVVPGDGVDLVNPDLTDLVDTLPADQRYSFTFDGNAQVLDHILVNQPVLSVINRFVYARDDADFPVKDYEDPAKPQRLSDHDQPIVYLSLGVPQPSGSVIISEFRFSGPCSNAPAFAPCSAPAAKPSDDDVPNAPGSSADNNEFIEIYNNTNSNITVSTTDGSAGWALVAADGVTRFIIPTGTVIPARGHFLGANTDAGGGFANPNGYTLSDYGGGGAATPNATYTTDIPNGSGIALFRTANPANFTSGERLDAAGYTTAPALYREGAGFPTGGNEMTSNIEYSFVRSATSASAGVPKDTGDNVADFIGVETNGVSTGAGQRLGAPGPENLSSPTQRNSTMPVTLLDPNASQSSPPNRARDLTPTTNGQFGTLSFRRTVTNNTGAPVTRLRFRIVEVTTFPRPDGATADLRALDSSDIVVSVNGSPVNVRGTTVEQPPAQPNGGGWNSSMRVGFVNLGAPLANNGSVSVQFTTGVQEKGTFRFFVNVEALN